MRAIKRFIKKCKKEKIIEKFMEKRYFVKPSEKRRMEDKKRRQNPLIKVSNAVEIRTHLLTKSQMVQKMSKEIDKKLLL